MTAGHPPTDPSESSDSSSDDSLVKPQGKRRKQKLPLVVKGKKTLKEDKDDDEPLDRRS